MASWPVSRSELAGAELGFGVVVVGVGVARGMELISRSEARGRVFVRRGCGDVGKGNLGGGDGVESFWLVESRVLAVVVVLDAEGGCCRLSLAFSNQTALVAGSMGQAEGGGSSAALAIVAYFIRRFGGL